MAKYSPPKSGSGLKSISAAGLRSAFRAGEAFDAGKLTDLQSKTLAGGIKRTSTPGTIAILNKTGKSLPIMSVVGLDRPVIIPNQNQAELAGDTEQGKENWWRQFGSFLNSDAREAVLPSAEEHFNNIAITQHWIPEDGYGVAKITGISKCLVRGTHPTVYGDAKIVNALGTARAAMVEKETTLLHEHQGGPFRIVWINKHPVMDKNGRYTDVYWAIVSFDQVPAGWTPFRNSEAIDVPAHSIMAIRKSTTGRRLGPDRGFMPTNGHTEKYVINGSIEIAPQDIGYAYEGSDSVLVRLNGSVAFPPHKGNYGPSLNGSSWGITYSDGKYRRFGYNVVSERGSITDRDGINYAMCRRGFPMELMGTTVTDATPGGIVDVKLRGGGDYIGPAGDGSNEGVGAFGGGAGNWGASGDGDAVAYGPDDDPYSEDIQDATPGESIPGETQDDILPEGGDGDISDVYSISARLMWMHGGEKVSKGKEVICRWFSSNDRSGMLPNGGWVIVQAECEDPVGGRAEGNGGGGGVHGGICDEQVGSAAVDPSDETQTVQDGIYVPCSEESGPMHDPSGGGPAPPIFGFPIAGNPFGIDPQFPNDWKPDAWEEPPEWKPDQVQDPLGDHPLGDLIPPGDPFGLGDLIPPGVIP